MTTLFFGYFLLCTSKRVMKSSRQVVVTRSISNTLGLSSADVVHNRFEKDMLIEVINREYKGVGIITQISTMANSYMIKVRYGTNSVPFNIRDAVLKESDKLKLESEAEYDIYYMLYHTTESCKNKRIIARSIVENQSWKQIIMTRIVKVFSIFSLLYLTLYILQFVKPDRYQINIV